MDEPGSRKTLNAEDFQIGDLVKISEGQALLGTAHFPVAPNKIFGIVVKDPYSGPSLALFPQVAIYVLKKSKIELHWPSYLEIVSAAND
jgi:hypothetical protein